MYVPQITVLYIPKMNMLCQLYHNKIGENFLKLRTALFVLDDCHGENLYSKQKVFFLLNWSIIALRCCVSFCCTMK